MSAWKSQALDLLKELKDRWPTAMNRLRARQGPSVRRVIEDRDPRLLGLLVVVNYWPDTKWPQELIEGFRAVGTAERSGIYEEHPSTRTERDQALEEGLCDAERLVECTSR